MVMGFLLPKIKILFFSFGVEDLVGFAVLPYALTGITNTGKNTWIPLKWYAFIGIVIIVSGILLGIFNSVLFLNKLVIPTEMFQYVKRLSIFLLTAKIIRNYGFEGRRLLRPFLLMLLMTLLIGILQLFDNPFSSFISRIYISEELQLEALQDATFKDTRNYSITGFSTSWGGLSLFIMVVGISFFVYTRTKGRHIRGYRLWFFMLMAVLGLINVIFSGSRGALLGLAGVLIFVLIYNFIKTQTVAGKIRFISYFVVFLLISAILVYVFFLERILFIQYRNEALLRAYDQGGNRFGDIYKIMDALQNPFWLIFGMSNAVQRASYVPYGVEVEPVYLIANYGLVGIVLRYGWLLMIFSKANQIFVYADKFDFSLAKAVGYGAMLGIVGYLTFSVGYFFFQETVAGCIPWIFFGIVAGIRVKE